MPGEENEGRLIAEFEKNSNERIRICLRTFKGYELVDLRTFYRGEDGEYRPGKGLSLRQDFLPELKAAIDEATRIVEADRA